MPDSDVFREISADRVRTRTRPELNAMIEKATEDNIACWSEAEPDAIRARIERLDREWDIERVLQTNASALAMTGTVLGLARSRVWFSLPLAVAGFLFQHAVQGWCPPVNVLRRFGFRTRQEIDVEKFALIRRLGGI